MRIVERFTRTTYRGTLVGLCCGLIGWLISLVPFFRGVEEWCQDISFTYRGARASNCRVAIVDLDERSLRAIAKPLVFSSDELVGIINYLVDHKVSVVGLDLMIPEDLDSFPGLGEAPARLGEIAAGSGKVVLPAFSIDGGKTLLRPLKAWRSVASGLADTEFVPLGLVGLSEDDDHFVRKQKVQQNVGGQRRQQFAMAMFELAAEANQADKNQPPGDESRVLPLDSSGRLRINYVGPCGTIKRISLRDVLAAARGGPAPTDQFGRPFDFEKSYVIVGATAVSLGDLHATPYSNRTIRGPWSGSDALMPGPEIHANLLATIDDKAFIRAIPWLSPMPVAPLIGMLLGAALARLSLGQGAALAVAHHCAWNGLSLAAFLVASRRIETVAMLITGGLCYSAIFALRWRILSNLFGIVKGHAVARARRRPGQSTPQGSSTRGDGPVRRHP